MSKSYGNAIFMSDRGEELKKKVAAMFAVLTRMRRSDPSLYPREIADAQKPSTRAGTE